MSQILTLLSSSGTGHCAHYTDTPTRKLLYASSNISFPEWLLGQALRKVVSKELESFLSKSGLSYNRSSFSVTMTADLQLSSEVTDSVW